MSTAQTPTHSRRFDPARPLEHTTIRNFRATGVGQASPRRLNAFIGLGVLGAATLAFGAPSAWLLAMPLVCLACFGVWGRAAQASYLLDVRHEQRPSYRRVLRAIQWGMVLVGLTAAFIGLIGLVMLLLEPNGL
jgi:hypothetical protein